MSDMQLIKDYIDLCAAQARYCRFLDTKDWDAYRELLTEDYELDISEGTGIPLIVGRDQAITTIRASVGAAKTVHQVHNPEIRVNGDEAQATWALQDRLVFSSDRPAITGYGHYHQRWVRRNGEWKLAALRLTRLLLEMQPPAKPAV
ncbi:MAG TPA: nuclear transport factor 2 family protein [Solimonas sp.]|nr:nuclear transport factor 2 family protein [Solimonas sp.]